MADTDQDEWMQLSEVSEYLKIRASTIRRWTIDKETTGIPVYRIGKVLRFRKKELDEWIKSGGIAAENWK